MTKLPRTAFALDLVSKHLDETGTSSSPIEGYLVQYLTVAFYSEMEEQVKRIYRSRLHFEGDQRLAHFVTKTQDKMMGRVNKSEIAQLAVCFGDECKTLFNENLEAQDIAYYGTVISNRHQISHAQGATITLPDFRKAIQAADKILISLQSAIQ